MYIIIFCLGNGRPRHGLSEVRGHPIRPQPWTRCRSSANFLPINFGAKLGHILQRSLGVARFGRVGIDQKKHFLRLRIGQRRITRWRFVCTRDARTFRNRRSSRLWICRHFGQVEITWSSSSSSLPVEQVCALNKLISFVICKVCFINLGFYIDRLWIASSLICAIIVFKKLWKINNVYDLFDYVL